MGEEFLERIIKCSRKIRVSRVTRSALYPRNKRCQFDSTFVSQQRQQDKTETKCDTNLTSTNEPAKREMHYDVSTLEHDFQFRGHSITRKSQVASFRSRLIISLQLP